MAFAQGDYAMAGRGWQQAHEEAEAAEDLYAQAHALPGIGLVALAEGDPGKAAVLFQDSIAPAEAVGGAGDWVWSLIHVWLGTAVMMETGPAAAVPYIEVGLASARSRGDRLAIYVALFNLSQARIGQGDHERARDHLKEGVRLSEQTRDLANLAYFLDALATVKDAAGDAVRVATLLGAAQVRLRLPNGPMATRLKLIAGCSGGCPAARDRSLARDLSVYGHSPRRHVRAESSGM